jgi:hypothetical protein
LSEVPKIADFGIARPTGINVTFGRVMLGTPGYAAPEQSFPSEGDIGPWTDVFSLACLVYYMLSGETYFPTSHFGQALLMVREPARKSLVGTRALCPELRDNPATCRAVDLILARATNLDIRERYPSAKMFASAILPALRSTAGPKSQRASERLVASVASRPFAVAPSEYTWTVRHPPVDDRLVRSAAWNAAGHCLAVTTEGLSYWNGTVWLPVRTSGTGASGLHSVSLVRPGQWLVAGQRGFVALVETDGKGRAILGPPQHDFTLASGDPEDLALIVSENSNGPPLLHSVAARHFFRPVPLEFARSVSALARLDDTQWLLTGRTLQGLGFGAVYSAIDFSAGLLPVPQTTALTTAAANIDRGLGIAAGRGGIVVRIESDSSSHAVLAGAPDLASSGIDVQGRAWVGGTGRLWVQGPERGAPWSVAWEHASFRVPFVSIRAEVGVVTALTVDGAVLEGRLG